MSIDTIHRPNDLSLCHQIIDEQQSTIDQLQRELAQSRHFVEQLLRSRYGPRSERVDPNQLSMFGSEDVGDSAPAPTPEEAASLFVREHVRRGGGRGRLPDHLPREVVDHDLADVDKSCPCCGETRQRIGCETSEQLEFVPAVLKVIEHRRWKYACRRCEEQVAIAPVPDKPIAKGLPGPGLLSSVVVSKYADHLPLYRLEDVFARSGVELSRSTLCRWALQAAAILEPVYQAMVERVRSSESIHTDDTPVPVLDASLPKTRTARLWVYCGDWRNPYTVYDYTTSRRRDGPVEFLKGFEGYLHADAFAGYDGIYAAGNVKQVLCWAHARRKFYDARTVQPEFAHVALAYIARLIPHRTRRQKNNQRRWTRQRARVAGFASTAFGPATTTVVAFARRVSPVAAGHRPERAAQESHRPSVAVRAATLGRSGPLLREWRAQHPQQSERADGSSRGDRPQELFVPAQRQRRQGGCGPLQHHGQR
jgi:transposase